MSKQAWTVHDESNDNIKTFATRDDAESAAQTAEDFGGDPTIYPPGEHPDDDVDVQPVEPEPDAATPDPEVAEDLPERSVAEDPLTWMPGEFVDTIDGSQAINRKGFEVLAWYYGVDTTAELQVAPEETDHDYARVKATATTEDGRTVEAFGSASTDRGDDSHLLLEMADTRARKRAISVATGAGAVAVSELKAATGDSDV